MEERKRFVLVGRIPLAKDKHRQGVVGRVSVVVLAAVIAVSPNDSNQTAEVAGKRRTFMLLFWL